MSQRIANLHRLKPGQKTREQMLALVPPLKYEDGRTKQSHRDETDIVKIMARFDKTGTISHLEKHEGVYADFSDFDFHEQTNMLTRGREIFDDLPAEIRREFHQSPAAFFNYVNDPANAEDLRNKLPALAAPGQQLAKITPPSADLEAAEAAASEPEASANPAPVPKTTAPAVNPSGEPPAPPEASPAS